MHHATLLHIRRRVWIVVLALRDLARQPTYLCAFPVMCFQLGAMPASSSQLLASTL